MRCKKCGKTVNDGSVLCNFCGHTMNTDKNGYNQTSGTGNVKIVPVIIAAVVVVVMVGVVSVFLIGEKTEHRSSAVVNHPDNNNAVQQYMEQQKGKSITPSPSIAAASATPNYSPSPTPADDSETFLFPSDRQYITAEDLSVKSQQEVALIRNEIYARRGYVFQTKEYQEYFQKKKWYHPNPDFNESCFSSIEKSNKDFIVEYEKKKGWRG